MNLVRVFLNLEGLSDDGSRSGTTSEYEGPACDPKISPDGTMSNNDEEGEGLFTRCFGWLNWFGTIDSYECYNAIHAVSRGI